MRVAERGWNMNLLTCLLPPQEVKVIARQARRRAWGRAYYPKRKQRQDAYERSVLERDRARRNAARVRRYYRNLEKERAASRLRMNALNAKRREICSP